MRHRGLVREWSTSGVPGQVPKGGDWRYAKASEAGWEAQWSVAMEASKPLPLPSEVRVGVSRWVPANTGRATAGHTGVHTIAIKPGL